MKRILVAGAGHGGLTAAYNLAKHGYNVKVIESKDIAELGYDWHDCIARNVFADSGLSEPDNLRTAPFHDIRYSNPSKTVSLVVEKNKKTQYMAERKDILNYLVSECRKAGVEFVFGKTVCGPITEGNVVVGLKYSDGEEYSDLVIDAAGVDSPVRKGLPQSFGIMKDIDSVFTTYRAYFSNTTETTEVPEYGMYFYHMNRSGMDWVITEREYIDVLVGSFNNLCQEQVDAALEDFKKEYPNMGEMIRGGQFTRIPLRRPLPLFVAGGYAAVGDSAAFTEPMSGSGICKSMKGGKILADVIVEIGENSFSFENLWKYQYTYMKKIGNSVLGDDLMRSLVSSLSGKDIDYFFESGIIGWKELRYNGVSHNTKTEMIKKVFAFVPKINRLPLLIRMLVNTKKARKARNLIPEVYSEKAYYEWASIYNSL